MHSERRSGYFYSIGRLDSGPQEYSDGVHQFCSISLSHTLHSGVATWAGMMLKTFYLDDPVSIIFRTESILSGHHIRSIHSLKLSLFRGQPRSSTVRLAVFHN